VQGELTADMVGGLSPEQASCAREIYQNTISAGFGARAAVIEICAAITETNLLNDTGGDGTSVGLFQMIDVLGTMAERENVPYETSWFLTTMSGLYPDGGWEWDAVGDVDQEVEVSAYPDRYQPNADDAQTIVNALVTVLSSPSAGEAPQATWSRPRRRRSMRASEKPTARAAESTVAPRPSRCSARSMRSTCW
jgi:hypothetical protein